MTQKVYTYSYDLLNRRTRHDYPTDSAGLVRAEKYRFDAANNLDTYTNRSGKVQTFTYDSRNRSPGFSWNDGLTPGCSMTYDRARKKGSELSIDTTRCIPTATICSTGRTRLDYPTDSAGLVRAEKYRFDAANNLDTYTNRFGKVQTFTYDSRNRATGFSRLHLYG